MNIYFNLYKDEGGISLKRSKDKTLLSQRIEMRSSVEHYNNAKEKKRQK